MYNNIGEIAKATIAHIGQWNIVTRFCICIWKNINGIVSTVIRQETRVDGGNTIQLNMEQ